MKAAIYTRYSSENQRETSLDDQERLCREEAARLGYAVVKVYKDKALSGALDEGQRPGFAAMQEAAKRREFDVLIVDDASRLSRDGADAARIFQRLQYWGVGLIARTDGVDTIRNPRSSLLIFGVKSAMNAEFRRDLAERVWRGLEGQVRKGLSPGGLPYGYRSVPIIDDRGRVTGHRRVIHEVEAEVVRRIFRLFVGDEGGYAHSTRAIAKLLNAEGVRPPGARWTNRTVRQAASWSYTAIIGQRKFRKGILNNPLYAGKLVWNRSQWVLDPDRKKHTARLRPASEWVEADVPELRIVPPDLWARAQARLSMHDGEPMNNRANVGKYLLSGFVTCAVCGGNFIKTNRSYRCGTHRNRGEGVCSNRRGATVEKLNRIVLAALRQKLYTPENLRTVIGYVRDELLALARQETRALRPDETAAALRDVEREIDNIKQAVKIGKATATLLEMLEDAERRRAALLAGREAPRREDTQARLERVLADLPARVQVRLEELETLLSEQQVERGRAILARLVREVRIYPDGTAEVVGDLDGVLTLASGKVHSVGRGGGI